jgi:hypothetical protein
MAELQGNGAKSDQIGGYIDLGIPQNIEAYRFFHGSSPWSAPIENTEKIKEQVGLAFFDPSQSPWQEPSFCDHLPNNDSLKISYMMGKIKQGCVGFIPTNRFGQRSLIHTCSFLDFPHGLKFISGNYLPSQKYDFLAGGLIVFDSDPTILTQNGMQVYMELVKRPYVLRVNKEYPEIFEYLGFCTWNTFYQAVDMEGMNILASSNLSLPKGTDRFKYLIVDDGWQSINDMDLKPGKPDEPTVIPKGLRNFEANCKFPNGIKEVSELLKSKYGFKWVGVWHAVLGYWPGVEPNSPLGRRYRIRKNGGVAFPDPTNLDGYEFWVDYYKHLRKSGIDLLKIDNQGSLGSSFSGLLPLDTAIENHYLMQQGAAYSQNLTILNCMCMASDNKIYWSKSNVSRVSDDFYPGKPELARHQITQCTLNSLWYSQFCWPDHDMFQTNSPSWNPLILLHMVSGGPVYIADEIDETKAEVVNKISFPDGRLPRLDRPGIPTNDIIFGDTRVDTPCKMWNCHDLQGWGRTYYYYVANMVEKSQPISTTIKLSDMGILRLSGMERSPSDEYVIKDQDSGFTQTIRAEDGEIHLKLDHMQTKYYGIHPLYRDIALIGLDGIYNGTKAIDFVDWMGKDILIIHLKYSGLLWFYSHHNAGFTATLLNGTPLEISRHPENPRLWGVQALGKSIVINRTKI